MKTNQMLEFAARIKRMNDRMEGALVDGGMDAEQAADSTGGINLILAEDIGPLLHMYYLWGAEMACAISVN